MLEEEIKRLEHHLNKVSNEMMLVKLQLTATEEQNEILQADLDRCKTRLHSLVLIFLYKSLNFYKYTVFLVS